MKKILITLALACMTICAFSQKKPVLRPRIEVAQVEDEANNRMIEVFYMDDESPRTYYLSLGNLGIGGHIVQIEVDPLFELFVPLGNNLDQAIETMSQLKAFYKMPKLSTMEIQGSFALVYPTDELIPVTVTRRKFLLTNILEFSIPTPGSETAVRATHISRSDLGSLLTGLKLHKKLHPRD